MDSVCLHLKSNKILVNSICHIATSPPQIFPALGYTYPDVFVTLWGVSRSPLSSASLRRAMKKWMWGMSLDTAILCHWGLIKILCCLPIWTRVCTAWLLTLLQSQDDHRRSTSWILSGHWSSPVCGAGDSPERGFPICSESGINHHCLLRKEFTYKIAKLMR